MSQHEDEELWEDEIAPEGEDAMIREEIWEGEDDGRDGSPAAGSSDSPESMDEYDPLRRRERLAGEDIGDLAGSGSHIEVLGEDDDDPEW
ncbi:hypothetical protein DWB68_01170 [Galactobacter valiniphilus]|uniref:Uncharacterized protein n=1 Tax=Galactobacter valiniphilus TaxID=2676122 RepID=A0A399JDC1_9MICC|nr:hypothetical protein [Galactobacter valiniphilus]RII43553.1 hypothetical protein DWB68_01170 [Galactobacter valiniphilus]